MGLAIKNSELPIDVLALEREEGNSALHIAVNLNDKASLKALLQAGPPKAMLKLKNREGNTPLHLAAIKDGEILALLIQEGASLTLVNKQGQTPIMIAIENDNEENAVLIFKEKLRQKLETTAALYRAVQMQERSDHYKTLKRLLLEVGPIEYKIALDVILMMANREMKMICGDDFGKFHAQRLNDNQVYRESFAPLCHLPAAPPDRGALP